CCLLIRTLLLMMRRLLALTLRRFLRPARKGYGTVTYATVSRREATNASHSQLKSDCPAPPTPLRGEHRRRATAPLPGSSHAASRRASSPGYSRSSRNGSS